MTQIEHDALYEQIQKLRSENENLRKSVTEKEKEISEADDAYEDLHDKYEDLQQMTEPYTTNKSYFDNACMQAQTLRDFVMYVVEECNVDPKNDHVFRCFRDQAVRIVKNLEV
jgi:predicted nuclease with TOPRIM domain